jgi:hypothetical protein
MGSKSYGRVDEIQCQDEFAYAVIENKKRNS